MSEKEISDIRETLRYYETTQTEPTYCEELITTGELKQLLEEIERLNNIINELENIINKMMYEDYVDGFTSYYATTEHSEFGVRGKLLLEKIQELKGDGSNDSKRDV